MNNNTQIYYGLVSLLRIRHWIKNLFVLAPLLFAGLLTSETAVYQAVIAMLVFCLASSSVYVFNDLVDMEYDSNHPVNSVERPLANGTLNKNHAITLLIILYLAMIPAFVFDTAVAMIALAYILLNIAYSLKLKKMPVIDLFVIATGFILRLYAGAVAIDVSLSAWMAVTTMSLALYLASIKRRQELIRGKDRTRHVISYYTLPLINRYAEISATTAIVFFSIYVMSEKPELVITIPLVIYGLFRYWFLVETQKQGESPTKTLTSDWHMIISILLWICCSIWAYYFS